MQPSNHSEAPDQLEIPLVSESAPRSRPKSSTSGGECREALAVSSWQPALLPRSNCSLDVPGMWDRCFFSILCVCVGNNCGKAHKLLTGAIENDKVAGDNFHYKLPLLLLAVGDGCQPHNRKMRWFLGGDFSIGLKFSATLRLFGKKVSDVRWLLWSLDMEVKNCGLNSIPILKATLPGQK